MTGGVDENVSSLRSARITSKRIGDPKTSLTTDVGLLQKIFRHEGPHVLHAYASACKGLQKRVEPTLPYALRSARSGLQNRRCKAKGASPQSMAFLPSG